MILLKVRIISSFPSSKDSAPVLYARPNVLMKFYLVFLHIGKLIAEMQYFVFIKRNEENQND